MMTSPFTMHFDAPRSISFTPDGTMILVESDGNRVAAITPAGEYTPVAGAGERGFSGDSGPALDALLSAPMDAIALPDGSILIADFGNNRVRKLVRPVAAEITAAVLRIVHGATGREGPLASGQIAKISGLDFTADDEIRFGEEPAMVLAKAPAEVTVIVPEALRGAESAPVVVVRNGEVVGLGTVELTENAPGILNVRNADGTTNSLENPALRGSVVTLRATGIQRDAEALTVLLGPYSADVLSVETAVDEPGIILIKARVPNGFVPAGDLPLVVRVRDAQSPPGFIVSLN
jgi:uncharacterized protein (TIGR03437 family)